MLTQLKMLVGTSVKCLEHAWFIENGIRHEGAIKCVEGLIELNLALRAITTRHDSEIRDSMLASASGMASK